MSINLNPSELQLLIEQITAALLPTFEKRVSTASKATTEAVYCLTVEEVGKRLKCHPKTVLKYIEDGRLKAYDLGLLQTPEVGKAKRPQYRTNEAELTAFLRAHRLGR